MSTFTAETKNTSSFAAETKSSSSFTNEAKNTASYTNQTKNISTFANEPKGGARTWGDVTISEVQSSTFNSTFADAGNAQIKDITFDQSIAGTVWTNQTKN